MAKANIIARSSSDEKHFNLAIQVRHGSERRMKKLDIKIKKEYWDDKRLLVTEGHRDAYKYNSKISRYEQLFYRAFQKANQKYLHVDFEKIMEEWNMLCYEDSGVESGDNVAYDFAEFVANHKIVDAELDHKTVAGYKKTVLYLEGYVHYKGGRLSVVEFAEESSFFSFGTWLRTPRMIHTSEGEIKKFGMSDASIRTILTRFIHFFKMKKKEGLISDFPQGVQIKAKYKDMPNVEDHILSEDMVEAIMQTEIDFEPKGKVVKGLLRERQVLDSLKLCIGHGFRYSDLISLTRKSVNIEIEADGETTYTIGYTSPKKLVPDIIVPFYPGTKEIIDFWANRPERTFRINMSHQCKFLREARVGAHFKTEKLASDGRGRHKQGTFDYAVHNDPLIPYGPPCIAITVRARLYEKIQMTWLINQYGSNWQRYRKEKIGFMQEVDFKSEGQNKRVLFYERLAYHFARHTFISRCLNVFNMPVTYVQKLVGHANLATTEAYVRVHKKEMVNKLKTAYANRSQLKDQPLRKAQ